MTDVLIAPAKPIEPTALHRTTATRYVVGHLLLVPVALAALAWFLQHGEFDMRLTRLFVDPATQTFPWRTSALLEILGHQAARGLPFIVGGVAISAGLASLGIQRLRPWTTILFAVGAAMLIGPVAVNLLKGMTTQHCPVNLQAFGGVVSYADDLDGPFWAATRQSAGHCLPSGHAGGGYALLALYFAGWAADRPSWRWRGLAIGIAAGLLFSVVRLMQGAHFASATVWSAAVDWTTCAIVFFPLLCRPTTRAR
ncbi:MAG: phosphatase PAP2 family protein [Caldimonas sp.]